MTQNGLLPDILFICSPLSAGDEALQAADAVLAGGARVHAVRSRDEYEVVRMILPQFAVVIVVDDLGWMSGLSVVTDIAATEVAPPVILIGDILGPDVVAEGFRCGLHDFVRSDQLDRLPDSIARALNRQRGVEARARISEEARNAWIRQQAIDLVVPDYVFSFIIHPDGSAENEWRSDGLERITGYSIAEFEALGWSRVVHPDDHHVLYERVERALHGETPVREYRIIARNGCIRWIRESTRAVWDPEEGRYTRFIGSAQDITEERRSEQLRSGQMRILEMIASGAPLDDIFQAIISALERQEIGSVCSLHRYDEATGQLLLAASSILPQDLHSAILSIETDASTAPEVIALGSGRAGATSQRLANGHWRERDEAARIGGFESLVTLPITGAGRDALGTLSVYRLLPDEPTADEMERITAVTRLAGIAIEKASSEQALRTSQLQYQALFDANPHLVFSLDTDGRFQRINQATEVLTGYLRDDLIGRPFTSVLVAGELEHVWHNFKRAIDGEARRFESEIFAKQGNRLHLRITMVPVVVDDKVIGVSGIAEDITEEHKLQEQLAFQAFHDSLTNLPNRTLLHERLSQAISGSAWTRTRVAMLFIDLDNFKVINDSLGHTTGDAYLKTVARWLESVIGPNDTVARFGGDEFIILMTYPEEKPGEPVRVAEQIGKLLIRPVQLGAVEVTSAASIGIAIQRHPDQSGDDLLREADIALYQAKRAGSSTPYRVFEDAMHDQFMERLEIERDLRNAIQRGEFDVHFQPIIDLRTGVICKVEALVRWNHPELGLLAPGKFLHVAEETGLISEIDEIVLRQGCELVARWNRQHPEAPPILLDVNLSTRDILQADLPEHVHATLRETGCDPDWLEFEITESTIMEDLSDALDVLKRLRQSGIGFSIDDFGTGYSSLAYLQRLPIDSLKIDRSFIDGLGGEDGDELMVRTIISLASELRLEVIAEGIETSLQLDRARELGCDLAQGFFISRPKPFAEIAPMLRRDFRHDVASA